MRHIFKMGTMRSEIERLKEQLYVSPEKVKDITEPITAEEQARRDYIRAWSLEEHGDYREYMERFKMK